MPGHAFDWNVLLMLGVLLGAALVAGVLADYMRLPKVTAYLLVGVLLGPTMLGAIEESHISLFEPLTKLAISLVLFHLGCSFPLARARRMFRRVIRLSLGELITTFLLVTISLLLIGQSWQVALLLGVLALATAPATTILVLKETESEGLITECTNSLVAFNNLVSIVLFELLFLGIHFACEPDFANLGPVMSDMVKLGTDLLGSVLLGAAGGLAVSYAFPIAAPARRLVFLIAVLTLLLAICQLSEMPYLLTFLAMGMMVANSSDQTRQVQNELDRITGLLCVVFFVAHGAELQLGKLVQAGSVGVVYVLARFCGKYFGVRFAAKLGGDEPVVANWLGTTLVSQAGAAIALSAIAVQRAESLGIESLITLFGEIQVIILGTVVVFELIGPILIRQAVLHAGEVPLANAIHHSTTGWFEQVRIVWNRLLLAAGLNPWKKRTNEDLTVRELMRKGVHGVPLAATFDDVISIIEHSRDNTYPVVGQEGELAGVIRYRELSNALFEPSLGSLVRAADVTTPAGWVLHPDETAARAYELFEATKDDCLPVVSREKPYAFQGLVRRRDVLRILIRGQRDSGENGK